MKNLAAQLNKKIDIESPNEVVGEGGGYSVSWVNFATVRAKIAPYRNLVRWSESFVDSKISGSKLNEITIRYMSNLTTNMRVVFNNRAMNIKVIINPDEKNERLILIAEEER